MFAIQKLGYGLWKPSGRARDIKGRAGALR